jgi:hypothetical protein
MKLNTFESSIKLSGEITFPEFSGIRILQMPFILGDIESIPDFLFHWKNTFLQLFDISHIKNGIAYITIDEKIVKKDETHRRKGLHVDGVFEGHAECTFGGGTFGTIKDGMYLASSEIGCRAWNQSFNGWAGYEGECDHLLDQCKPENEVILNKNKIYWLGGLCVHESIPMKKDTKRTLIRMTLPNDNPCFDGFTLNPKGIKHEGKMLPRRSKFMDNNN